MKDAVIQTHQQEVRVSLMCRVLQVSRSGFYASQKQDPKPLTLQAQRLRIQIRSIHCKGGHTYGCPRVHQAGVVFGRKRVERIVREDGLAAERSRRFRTTADSSHD